MKISLVLHPERPLSRSEAWACFSANIALPGSGSLLAGRAVGYFQILLALIGLGVSLFTTLQAIVWYYHNYHRLSDAADPLAGFVESIRHLALPAAGMGIFVLAILWAAITSWSIIRGTPKV
jgi:hypothetical protein